jgi:predicted DNA-binding protein (MmcQ/YjbR family)
MRGSPPVHLPVVDGRGSGDDDHGVDAGELREYALAKPGAWADQPWEGDHVAKVGAKIFAFLGDSTIGVKCGATRDEADEWLARYPDDASVMAYIGRSGWNTLRLDGSIPDDELVEAVDASYDLVVAKLPKKDRPAGWSSSRP